MGIDVKRARRALKSAGARGASVLGTAWPLGRQGRLRNLLRRRLAVLEAKNAVIDFLYRSQGPLAELRLFTIERVQQCLKDPETRKRIIGVSPSREVIAEELISRSGAEVGRSLEQALSELVREGEVLQVPGKDVVSRDDVYLAVQRGRRPHYDTSELNRLVRQGLGYSAELRKRTRRDASTTGGRSYDL